jgi:hypothetical protein
MSAETPRIRELHLIVGFDGSPAAMRASPMHRMVGSVAVNLARHSTVPVTIVP